MCSIESTFLKEYKKTLYSMNCQNVPLTKLWPKEALKLFGEFHPSSFVKENRGHWYKSEVTDCVCGSQSISTVSNIWRQG
jgi:hypothetical protein